MDRRVLQGVHREGRNLADTPQALSCRPCDVKGWLLLRMPHWLMAACARVSTSDKANATGRLRGSKAQGQLPCFGQDAAAPGAQQGPGTRCTRAGGRVPWKANGCTLQPDDGRFFGQAKPLTIALAVGERHQC